MQKKYIVEHNGQQYQVVIIHRRLRQKSIRFYYRDDVFYASSSPLVLDAYIIKKFKDKYFDYFLARVAEKPITNEYVYIYGKKYSNKYPNDIVFNDGSHLKYSDEESFYKSAKKIFYKMVIERLRYYEHLMNLPEHQLTIRAMKTRHGTFSKRTNRVTISLYLFHRSEDMINSVIVHELAHHLVMNHSKAFYQIVYKYCPNYKALHKRLNAGEYI